MTAPPRALTFIHTVTTLAATFDTLLREKLPGWQPSAIVDESLLRTTIARGELTPATLRRCLTQIWQAVDSGAEAVVVTCSSLGPAVEAARPFCPVPLFRIDEGMAVAAVAAGPRIGVLGTLSTTLAPTTDLIRMVAARTGQDDRQVTSRIAEGAFQRLQAGDAAAHDAAVASALRLLAPECDVIVLAQASMARAAAAAGDLGRPVLTSPELGISYIADRLSA
jgi:Asp/Glu/hydantoin racemase